MDLCNLNRNAPQKTRKVSALKDDWCLSIIEGLDGWLMYFGNAIRKTGLRWVWFRAGIGELS